MTDLCTSCMHACMHVQSYANVDGVTHHVFQEARGDKRVVQKTVTIATMARKTSATRAGAQAKHHTGGHPHKVARAKRSVQSARFDESR